MTWWHVIEPSSCMDIDISSAPCGMPMRSDCSAYLQCGLNPDHPGYQPKVVVSFVSHMPNSWLKSRWKQVTPTVGALRVGSMISLNLFYPTIEVIVFIV